jgi:hypothetical protein
VRRFLVYMIIVLWATWATAQNDDVGGGCCGKDHCKPVAARILKDLGDQILVEVEGIQMTVPRRDVRPSNDQNDYWCTFPSEWIEPGTFISESMKECIGGKISRECFHCLVLAIGA